MNIKHFIRNIMHSSMKGQILFYKLRLIREKIALRKSDIEYVNETYLDRFGTKINLANPQTFQEKLQWLKLFYRDSVMPKCSDKAKLKDYLQEIGMEYLSNEIIGVYSDARDIKFDELPDKFVAKANHGSGWNLICENKNELNWKDAVKLMNSWLKLNLYVFGREWNYKDIEPRIVVEKFLDHKPLNDYKYMCFNGEPLYMQLNNDHDGIHYVDFYEIETWKHLPCTYGPYKCSAADYIIPKPPMHEKMMELARKLSKRFPFVRVDFYNFDDTILLGELTFFPGGGLWPFNPREVGVEWDQNLGEKLQLPEPNHNLELLEKIQAESK